MNKVYCRVYQGVLKIGNYFLGYRTPATLTGAGCIRKLPEQIKARGLNHVLIVCGPNIFKRGMLDGLFEEMDKLEIKHTVFCDLQANPTDENVEAGLKVFKDNGCQGIIAFGGGSPMDCAKAIAARNANPRKTVAQMQGLLKAHRKIVPFWAVPTTAGTGSETTVAAVITEAKTHHKASINDTAILPRQAVLDPELTVGLPPFVTATTGMDALCHAVESYTNWTYCTKVEKDYSKQACKLIYENLYKAFENGSDIEARQNMQLAAFYAGRSFTRGCVGYVHACGHPLSALYSLPHGHVMAVLLPHVMRQFGSAVYKRLAELAEYCGIEGATDEAKALAFIEWMEQINAKMGIGTGFPEIKDEDIEKMVVWADKEANPLYPVPVIWGKKEFTAIYREIKAAGEEK